MAKLVKRGEKYFIKKDKQVDEECLEKGTKIEAEEHPSFTEKQVRQIAMDHLKEDPEYYEDEENEEEETEA